MDKRGGMLYPLMILAALSVILFSIVGIATMTDKLPSAFSQKNNVVSDQQEQVSSGDKKQDSSRKKILRSEQQTVLAAACGDCGVIESIRMVEVKGEPSGVGVVAGGLTGAILGNQVGRGSGRTAATILGAAGGAYVGNEIEKNTKKSSVYRIAVRMEDGSYQTITQRESPAFGVGEKIRIVNGRIIART